jgi:hypothetical protein
MDGNIFVIVYTFIPMPYYYYYYYHYMIYYMILYALRELHARPPL